MSASLSQGLDPNDQTPQAMFVRYWPGELTVYIVRFRSVELLLDAVRHNERVPQFATMKDPECPPFVCIDGKIKTAHRCLMERVIDASELERAKPATSAKQNIKFAPCTCGIIKGDCACTVQKDGKRGPGNFEED